MTRKQAVAVGVDGSEPSNAALDWAAAEAERRGWTLEIVCSYSLPSYTGASLEGAFSALDDDHLRRDAQHVVDEAANRVARDGLAITTTLDTGDPAGVLIDISREVSLVVVGTRGGGGFADRLLGTVSSAVPAHAHCPTVVVPFKGEAERFMPVRRIVVGLDGSESARIAMRRAVDEAHAWDAELTTIAAVPIPPGIGLGWVPDAIDRREVLADVQTALENTVTEAVDGRDVRAKMHALDGNAAALMAEFSTAVELLVVGTRGRGGFRGLLMGSTSQAVLHHAACPVMVVPARVANPDEGFDPTDVPWRTKR